MSDRKQAIHIVVMAAVISTVLVLVSGPSAGLAADKDPAGILPADCFLMVTVPSVTETIANFKKTGIYGLYKEPAMRRFIEPAEKNLREFIEDKLKSALKGTGINSSLDSLPWPKGRVTLAVRMGKKTVKVPVFDWENYSGEGRPKLLRHQERKINSPRPIVLADMGDNAKAAGVFLDKLIDRQIEEGNWRRTRRTVHGVRLSILLPPKTKRPDDDAEIIEEVPMYGFKGSTLLFSTDFKLVREVLGLLGGEDRRTLSGDENYRKVMRKLGKADVSMYLNIKSLIETSFEDQDAESRKRNTAMIRNLGADALTGLGVVVRVTPRGDEQFRIKMLLGVNGERRGLVKLLAPGTSSTNPGRLLTKGLAGFLVANYDLGKMYDQVCLLVREVGNIDVDKYVQTAMKATKPPIGGEPVNARTEVFGQLTGPITLTSRLTKPYTDPDSSRTMLAVGVRNSRALDSALGRIHNIIIAGGDPKLRRELRKRNVYLLSGGNVFGALLGMAMGAGPMKQEHMAAFAVADDNFVIGSVKTVEQSIRDLGRKDIEAIGADPMYQHASRYLPARAALYAYQNEQTTTAASWEQMRAAAKEAAKNPRRDPSVKGPDSVNGVPRRKLEIGLGASTGSSLPMLMINPFKDFVDFSALPDFEAVRKYYGAGVMYVKGTDEGIFAEIIQLKAPGR